MRRFLHNLQYRPSGERINPLAHVFFYITFVFGVAFVIFPHTMTVQVSPLFLSTLKTFGVNSVSVWGYAAMAVTVANTVAIGTRKFLTIAPLAGFCLWLYGLLVYGLNGLWFQVIVGAIPNLWFWTYYYLFARWYLMEGARRERTYAAVQNRSWKSPLRSVSRWFRQ